MAHLWIRIHTIKSQGTIHMRTEKALEQDVLLHLINNGYGTEQVNKETISKMVLTDNQLEQFFEEAFENMCKDLGGQELFDAVTYGE